MSESWAAFEKLGFILKSWKVPINPKIKVYNSCIFSVNNLTKKSPHWLKCELWKDNSQVKIPTYYRRKIFLPSSWPHYNYLQRKLDRNGFFWLRKCSLNHPKILLRIPWRVEAFPQSNIYLMEIHNQIRNRILTPLAVFWLPKHHVEPSRTYVYLHRINSLSNRAFHSVVTS